MDGHVRFGSESGHRSTSNQCLLYESGHRRAQSALVSRDRYPSAWPKSLRNPGTPSEWPMHPSQQPSNTESNDSGRIWLSFDGVAEPLVERCGSISGGVGGLSI